MAHTERNGIRKTREQLRNRVPELGRFFIVTDTKETEQNYIYGLRDSIPKELQGRLVIKVIKTKTKNLVEEAMNYLSINPQYGEAWIIFDRDQVPNFDDIISQAEENGINVGWSNPCIEIWFSAYFDSMPTYQDSVSCCDGFAKCFKKISNKKYIKSDKEIYEILNKFGDEENAIILARQKFEEQKKNGNNKPSQMCPCTTVHCLVEKVKSKINKE